MMSGFLEMMESNCGRKICKGRFYGYMNFPQLYNLLTCGTLMKLNGIFKKSLIIGTNYFRGILQRSTIGNTKFFATIAGK